MRVVETVDVSEDGDFGITTRLQGPLPEHLCLDRFEESLNGRIEVANSHAAYRDFETLLAWNFPVVV